MDRLGLFINLDLSEDRHMDMILIIFTGSGSPSKIVSHDYGQDLSNSYSELAFHFTWNAL